MSRWFRVDDGLVDDPKLQQLPLALFKATINLWCITSQNGGNFPPIEAIAFKLRTTTHKVEKLIQDLTDAGLIDEDDAGKRPHNWNARQFKSDVSTERVKRFRKRDETVSVAVSETDHNRAETEQSKAESEKKEHCPVAKATRTAYSADFEEFWKAYPRTPNMSKAEAFMVWKKLSEDDRKAACAAVPRYSEWLRSKPNHEIIHACRFLSKKRFDGFLVVEPDAATAAGLHHADAESPQLEAWDEYGLATKGKKYPRDKLGGWTFATEWPPGHEPKPDEAAA